MPRFVVLTHDFPVLHWDFMLEQSDSLRTWRLLKEPDSDGPIEAKPLADHRLDYLDYEGPVSDNRGSVSQWDAGTYDAKIAGEFEVVVMLNGRKLKGVARIFREAYEKPFRVLARGSLVSTAQSRPSRPRKSVIRSRSDDAWSFQFAAVSPSSD